MSSLLLSVDLEDVRDWVEDGARYREAVPRNTALYLQHFQRWGVKATFFVVGEVARRYPRLIAEIADAAAISQRECLRCFQKTIQLSPIQYVLKYRIMQGADQLLTKPTKSIAAIAAACGFDSQSHFAKTFKRFYAHTPRENRKKHGESRSTDPGRSE